MDTNFKPIFSVIIPTYNSANALAKTLQSVLDQSFSSYEVIVVDGLSSDDTLSIARSFNNKSIRVVSEKDNGIYDAMNKGIRLAKGSWLYFLGSDDTLYNHNIFNKINRVIATHHKSKIIFGDVYTSDNTIERFTNYGFTELLDRNVCHQSIFYHRSLFDDKLYSTNYKICSDWDFNLQAFVRKNHPVHVKELIARFNIEGASGDWQTHPEYLQDFKSKKQVIGRYKGKQKLYFYYGWYLVKRYARKIKEKLTWMFR